MTVVASDLVPALRAGDPDAFAEIYRSHAGALYRYLLAQLRDHGTAEDLTNETFVRTLRSAHTLRESTEELRPWLFRIARNLLFDHVGSARNRREVVVDRPDEDHRSWGPDPLSTVIQEAERTRLVASLNELSEDQRQCLMLRFLGDATIAETAAVMGRKTGAIRVLQYRAIRRLAEIIEGRRANDVATQLTSAR